jgi:hypothetical protein
MDKDLTPWYMPEWLSLSTLRSYTWENEVYLYVILGIPLVFALRWLWRYRFNQKLPVAVAQKGPACLSCQSRSVDPRIINDARAGVYLHGLGATPKKQTKK